jgi:nicotinate-nucleotide pyrophosphorylase (carboxylating)
MSLASEGLYISMHPIDIHLLRDVLIAALREDVGGGDITSRATIPADARARGRYTTKQSLISAGIPVIQEVVSLVDSDLRFQTMVPDGTAVTSGTVLAEMHGPAASVLIAERTTLNLLQRMCGIATLTHEFVERVKGTKARIVDTRKTMPGLRILDKYAVSCGGGMNHRMGLFDGVLIKNNHLAFHHSVSRAIKEARTHLGHLVKVEVEVRSLDEFKEALQAGADIVLLDNFTPELTKQAVEIAAGRVPLESSGGITLDTVRQFADAGADYISVGALTHSVPAVDIHLRVSSE